MTREIRLAQFQFKQKDLHSRKGSSATQIRFKNMKLPENCLNLRKTAKTLLEVLHIQVRNIRESLHRA